jgi:hypothetical protein
MGLVYNWEEQNVSYGAGVKQAPCGPWFSPCSHTRVREIGQYIAILIAAGVLLVYNERRLGPHPLSALDDEKRNDDKSP